MQVNISLKQSTLRTTIQILNVYYMFSIDNNLSNPLINVNEDSELILEWWFEDRKLTLYINETEVHYIKIWGLDIDNEMEDSTVKPVYWSDYVQIENLLNWLVTNESTI